MTKARSPAVARLFACATVSPLATVARGYAILQHDDGRIVRAVGDAAVGDAIDARLVDGRLRVRVESTGE